MSASQLERERASLPERPTRDATTSGRDEGGGPCFFALLFMWWILKGVPTHQKPLESPAFLSVAFLAWRMCLGRLRSNRRDSSSAALFFFSEAGVKALLL